MVLRAHSLLFLGVHGFKAVLIWLWYIRCMHGHVPELEWIRGPSTAWHGCGKKIDLTFYALQHAA
jgi:hypothetical protein